MIDPTKAFLRRYQLAAMANVHIRDDVDPVPHLALGLTGEAGEVADEIKKTQYLGRSPDDNTPRLIEELGDVLFYVATIAGTYGYSLDELALINAEKLAERYPDSLFARIDDE